jgi:hypothetical protein
VLPVQAIGELFNVLVKEARRPAAAARTAMLTWRGVTVTNPFGTSSSRAARRVAQRTQHLATAANRSKREFPLVVVRHLGFQATRNGLTSGMPSNCAAAAPDSRLN